MSASNKILQAAAGNAAGGEGLYVEDVFSTSIHTGTSGTGGSTYVDTGVSLGTAHSSGSILLDGSADTYARTDTSSQFNFGTGNFTYEGWIFPRVLDGTLNTGNRYVFDMGPGNSGSLTLSSSGIRYYNSTTSVQNNNTFVDNFQWTHLAVSRYNGTTKVFKNGTQVLSFSDSHDYGSSNDKFIIGNYNSNSSTSYKFIGNISNVRVSNYARYTSNFTPPTSAFTSDGYTLLLTASGDDPFLDNGPLSLTVNQLGLAEASEFGAYDGSNQSSGGLLWIKDRDGAQNHMLLDTESGKYVNSNSTSVGALNTYVDFTSTGYHVNTTLGSLNQQGDSFVGWTFRKAPKFFDVVTYTGNGTAGRTISHNLGSVPGCIIVKRTDRAGDNWKIYHRSTTATKFFNFTTAAAGTDASYWNNTEPTSTVFTVGHDASVNGSGGSFVAYLFAHNDGDGEFGESGDQDIIKCGSYTGNGSTTGPEIDLGFEPQWLMVKSSSLSENWHVFDNMRGVSTGGDDSVLYPNLSSAESTSSNWLSFTSTGFKITATFDQVNSNTNNYIYIAIRRGPMKTPESGTEVFDINTFNYGSISLPYKSTSGIVTDLSIDKGYAGAYGVSVWNWQSRLQGSTRILFSEQTSSESTGGNLGFDFNDGVEFRNSISVASGSNNVHYQFRRAPGFFDVVTYTGNSTADRAVPHNLKAIPELIITKCRSSAKDWAVYTPEGQGFLNTTNSLLDSSSRGYSTTVAFTDTNYYLHTTDVTNESPETYIAYLFATLPGVSKVGSFVGDGTNGRVIDCGFTNGARFVMMKKASTTGNWLVYDTERGIVAGNDPYLIINSTGAEVTTTDYIDPDSSGFAVNSQLNTDTVTWIFLAIA